MSSPVVYVGMDIAKATLDLHAPTAPRPQSRPFANDPTGHRALVRWLQKLGLVHVVCEATGGYERAGVAALHQAAIAVSVVNPRRAHDFAPAQAQLAKTDQLDAQVLAEFGQRLQPAVTPQPSAVQRQLANSVTRRQQVQQCAHRRAQPVGAHHAPGRASPTAAASGLSGSAVGATAHLDHRTGPGRALAGQQGGAVVSGGRRGAHHGGGALGHAAGVGHVESTASGGVGRGRAAQPRQRALRRGHRLIGGGRPAARRALYMAALAAAFAKPRFQVFYGRLVTAGKAPKVALVAVMRKRIILLNQLLKNPEFQPT
jgi:transposase